ncbi:MAG: response regulator transcription factor [Gammaproteobacteria bacterium]|nr:response regulator transcription factor [Gammaproteobacteria bacterium]NIR84105.1 response regulator transcription factor [Gammaproteobacteria bacterium]NIU05268.1 response regulator transcription factor [Gammaproteobacteria bacterium]NIX86541.1 response regulator [Gammaproteobacteria bacterium]
MRVLLVDDHAMFRFGLTLTLKEKFKDISVSEAATLAEGLKALKQDDRFDLLLLDLYLPDADGTRSLSLFLTQAGAVPVAVLSASDSLDNIAEVLRAGARGYIPKTASADVLCHAIQLILSGEIYVPSRGTALLLENRERRGVEAPANGKRPKADAAKIGLSKRQTEILRLVVAGRSNKEIARELGIAEGTVKAHLRAVMTKVNARNRTHLAVEAAKSDLL